MAYSKEIWDKAKVLYEMGKSLKYIAYELDIKNHTTITKKANAKGWIKNKIQGLKSDIKAFDNENSTLVEKKEKLVEKIAQLDDFEITILDDAILDETKKRSILFSTANLSLIRKNQMLTKNKKTVLSKVDYFDDNGKKIKSEMEETEVPLTPNDYKTLDEGIDKNAISLDLAPRHAPKSEINNTNAQQNNEKTIKVIYE